MTTTTQRNEIRDVVMSSIAVDMMDINRCFGIRASRTGFIEMTKSNDSIIFCSPFTLAIQRAKCTALPVRMRKNLFTGFTLAFSRFLLFKLKITVLTTEFRIIRRNPKLFLALEAVGKNSRIFVLKARRAKVRAKHPFSSISFKLFKTKLTSLYHAIIRGCMSVKHTRYSHYKQEVYI